MWKTGAVCAVEGSVVWVGAVEELELPAVHVPGVEVCVAVVDYYFYDLVVFDYDGICLPVDDGVGGVFFAEGESGVEGGDFLADVGVVVDFEARDA